MNWLLIAATLWYWWRIYSLSFNPSTFPDQKYANAIWEKRSTRTFVLGAIIITATLSKFGLIHERWVQVIAFVVLVMVVGFLQPFLVGLIILHRTACVILRVKVGRKPHAPRLAPYAWTYYLTEEEKRKALGEGIAEKTRS